MGDQVNCLLCGRPIGACACGAAESVGWQLPEPVKPTEKQRCGPSPLRAAYRTFRLMEELRQVQLDRVRRYAPQESDRKAHKPHPALAVAGLETTSWDDGPGPGMPIEALRRLAAD